MPNFDMNRVKTIHLVGIGGCGMSGIAKVLHEMGFKVSGSDVKENPNTIRLKDLGIKVSIGHEEANIRDTDLLVYSSALKMENVELKSGKSKGITIIKRAEMLSWIMDQSREKIAVAGTHGKTTITAMITKVLDLNRFAPTYFIGCDMDYDGGNAKLGSGRYAVAEADESDSSFLYLNPTVGIISNIEDDHMERFGSMSVVLETFEKFAQNISPDGFILVDGHDVNIQALMKKVKNRFVTYGLNDSGQYTARDLSYSKFGSRYILVKDSVEIGAVELSVPGWQNILNSLPVFALGFEFGLDFGTIAAALRTFIGARRRFQTVGEVENSLIVDDYAHHPTEVLATLSAAKLGWPKRRIICIFQPHRYSRTALLKDRFAAAFSDADKVIITDIYAASEQPIPGITGKTIADGIKDKDVHYIPRKEQIAEFLIKDIRSDDLILTLGAGDIYTVGREILSRLKMRKNEAEIET